MLTNFDSLIESQESHELLARHIDTISLALSPYCCGPGESFTLEPIRDAGTYTHDNTYLWLDMTWEQLRGRSQLETIRTIHGLCRSVLRGACMRRIVLMTGQAPVPVVRARSEGQGAGGTLETQAPVRLKAPPLIEYMAARADQNLPLLPKKFALPQQENMVPVTRTIKNGMEVVVGWRKPNGPMVVSFDPILRSDEKHNRKRRVQRMGEKARRVRDGYHVEKKRKNTHKPKCA
jgi:hypothetical protein